MYFKHLTFEDRVKLQFLLETSENSKLKDLSEVMKITASTLSRELKRSTVATPGKKSHFMLISQHKHKCPRTSKFPYCCNGCNRILSCSRDLYLYDAYGANENSIRRLRESRRRNDKKQVAIEAINRLLTPQILGKQSIEVARLGKEEILPSAMTIRRYCNDGLLAFRNIDLPRTVRFRVKKEYKSDNRHVGVRILYGRLYSDYLKWMGEGSHRRLEIDTVIGLQTDKCAILTIFDPITKLQFGFLVKRGAEALNRTLLDFYEKCQISSTDLFDVILTDNGSEMQGLPEIESEAETGLVRFKVFYCDPYRSNQKGGCERNHVLIRRLYQKGRSMDTLQVEDVKRMFSLANSYPRKSLGFRSPIDVFKSKYGDGLLELLGYEEIPLTHLNFKQIRK